MMNVSDNIDILRGRCQELPEVRSKVVRVFISSTFSDTLSERDSLIENVFPKLKDYCREKYGLEFQYSDMRWGIDNESADNHSEVQTCLHEIELCQKYSIATNFLVLLSHRYGSRPTPVTITASLFERLQQIVLADPHLSVDAELLSQWYRLDTNSIPATYILRSISSMLPNIKSKNSEEMKAASREWTEINNRIRTCLRQAAAKCFEQSEINANEYDDFFISVTEQEIVNGILSVSNANERTLCFVREIVDIRDHLSDSKAAVFIDTIPSPNGEPMIDHEIEELLNRLKYTRIPNALQSNNIYTYKVQWSAKGINRRDHAEYISKFNDDVYSAIKQQIDNCAKSRITRISDPLQHEILEHAIQCRNYVAKFHGRVDVLSKLEQYIRDEKESRPCMVYGASGCGKTSVLAKAATEASKWWSNRSVSVILRFLGTTPTSSTVYKTMLSISQHICKLYNIQMDVYPDTVRLRYQLAMKILPCIPSDEYLIIILDSIDQLEPDAYDCSWLPAIYPHNVKCIVSAIPDHGNILEHFKEIIKHAPSFSDNMEDVLVNVLPFEANTVELVFDDWLAMKQRSLSDVQRSFIRELMKKAQILPLYMKLIFDIILTWHSYDPIDANLKKLNSVDDCIRYLFNYLKTVHNSLLFTRAVCYMTACRNGISQNELEDVLSLDDDVLKSVFQHYIPPIRRIPGILWTRIRNDLEEYITEKEADDSSVVYWYHRRFIEVVNSEYLSKMSSAERTTVFQNMVDMYKETWKGKNKPFKVDDPKLVNKYNLNESDGEIQANRFTTSQPIEFVDASGNIQFNKRKLNELPQFINQLTANFAIPIACKEVYFNYKFMRAKVACSTFNDILDDFQKITSSSSYSISDEAKSMMTELKVFSVFFLSIGGQCQKYPENFPFDVTCRLLAYYGIKPLITDLIQQVDTQGMEHCALIVPYGQLQPPGSGLIYSMTGHMTAIIDFDFTEDQMKAITVSDRIVVMNMAQVVTVLDISLPNLDEPYLNSTTLPKTHTFDGNKEIEEKWISRSDNEDFKDYVFLVNSLHHIYLITSNETIKFDRSSKVGYLHVEVLDKKRALCVIVENDADTVECWDVVRNRLFDRLTFPQFKVKYVLCEEEYSMMIIVLHDGTIQFHAIDDWNKRSFAHRGSIQAGIHLDLVSVAGGILIATFDATIPIDFAMINLEPFYSTREPLSDKTTIKTLVAFDPPIGPKPFKSIIMPDSEGKSFSDIRADFPFFMVQTNDAVFVVHVCKNERISYIRIKGQFSVVSMHRSNSKTLYAARGGTIELHTWACYGKKDSNGNCDHKHQLLVSFDISSSPVTTIKSKAGDASLFVCSMANGSFHVYYTPQVRESFKNIPLLPRANERIRMVKLLNDIAITLDDSKRELVSWSYQYTTSIHSTRLSFDGITINEFAVASSSLNSDDVFVMIITSNHWFEIYSAKSLGKEAMYSFHLQSPANIHATHKGTFFVLTNNGVLYCISQQVKPDGQVIFDQTANAVLKMKCSVTLSSVLTLNGLECLIVFADNGRKMAVWTTEQLIYMDVNVPYDAAASSLKCITSERTQDFVLLYFDNKMLIACQVKLDRSGQKGSLELTTYGPADKYCLRKSLLAAYHSENNQLTLHDIQLRTRYEPIQLDNECQLVCLNESADYVFALVKPRILFMYRTKDGRQLAKLFTYDYVSFITASNDFLVLAMNDRRLLTMMIGDPNDPTLPAKIQALPSRNPKRLSQSAIKRLEKHIEKCGKFGSSDEDESNFESDEEEAASSKTKRRKDSRTVRTIASPISIFRLVTRLNGRHSLSKMRNDEIIRSQINTVFMESSEASKIASMAQDSDDDDHDDDDVQVPNVTIRADRDKNIETALNDIRQKNSVYDEQQIKGVQFANAGDQNPKVVNNYAMNSSTCNLI
ncbi:unnamed protein product [Rotaria magnacalcarata]|uniref:NACHT and WD repeat domain-containing protein 2 n=1 Tax=Rotaria magnacalcarata TaxID=392030 RepID=A0A816F0A0_9BILA|nr:unnamed protein product [Rotaria magnacalcarata]CAF1654783.1 unnamed protein product [Rotaria magnacalcarata]CAF3760389.1 unnamed protein product [Rotaria magnacalcarata]CAF3792737.1 unnamed protein product [Rotaria magnacalcarata]